VKWGFIDRQEHQAGLPHLQRRRIGARHVQGPQIIYKDPHQLLEGMIIACFANNVHLAYIYIRGEFTLGAKILEKAIAEAKAKNFLGKNISAPATTSKSTSIAARAPTSAARKPA
jgi:NADH-quinone oxidoreductase subunit F